ncbi:MAG: hypothetical protein IJW46_05825 [Clostridia bacterium]|nr:hypothetical protein [Clostridia bacterium]
MKVFTCPEIPFAIVNSYRVMKERCHKKDVSLFGLSAKASVAKALFGAVTVTFTFTDASERALKAVRQALFEQLKTPARIAGEVLIFHQKGIRIAAGLREEAYGCLAHILTVSFGHLPYRSWRYDTYQAYTDSLRAVWKTYTLYEKSIPGVSDGKLSAIVENESRFYLISIQKRSYRFYASIKKKEANATRISPLRTVKGRYHTLADLAKRLDTFFSETKEDDI